MKKRKARAFTIMEVTIVMLIAGLLIGLTYTSYSIVSQSYRSFTNRNDDMTVLVNLDHVLKRDFGQAEIILKDTSGITLKREGKTIKYSFNPDFITRISGKIDTFKVQTRDVKLTFESQSVNEMQAGDEQNRVDDLAFTLVFLSENIPNHYHKLYSSVNLIKRNPNAIN